MFRVSSIFVYTPADACASSEQLLAFYHWLSEKGRSRSSAAPIVDGFCSSLHAVGIYHINSVPHMTAKVLRAVEFGGHEFFITKSSQMACNISRA